MSRARTPAPLPAAGPCPCGQTDARGRPLEWAACCQPWLDGGQPAPDAQALMRSRYSAYVRQDRAYLLATWHPDTRPASLDFEPGVRWLGLTVQGHWPTGPDSAEVRFVARLRQAGGPAVRLHEHSRFRRVDGRWLYVDGDDLAT